MSNEKSTVLNKIVNLHGLKHPTGKEKFPSFFISLANIFARLKKCSKNSIIDKKTVEKTAQ